MRWLEVGLSATGVRSSLMNSFRARTALLLLIVPSHGFAPGPRSLGSTLGGLSFGSPAFGGCRGATVRVDMSMSLEDIEARDLAAREELEAFATTCNPQIEFFDPLDLTNNNFWGTPQAATISFLRHAEMKHGRVAMLAFLGYVASANHLTFPWCTPENGYPPAELSPPEQWDVLDPLAKFQLFFFIGMLEIWSESAPGQTHYMAPGGVPGKYPKFVDGKKKRIPGIPVDLWDPLGLIDNMTPEVRNIKLAKEVNNGRLAMLGVTSFFVESKVPGAVPLLSVFGVVQPYEGEYMMPFSYWNVIEYLLERSDFSQNGYQAATDLDMTPW